MAKVKEQVKYNPDWSETKRVEKVRRALAGPSNMGVAIAFTVLAGLMFGFLVFGCIFDPADFFEDGVEELCVFGCGGVFMLFMLFMLHTALPFSKNVNAMDRAQRNIAKGSYRFVDTYMHLPVRRVALYKQSFRPFFLMMLLGSLPGLFINVMVQIRPLLDFAKGFAAMMCIVLPVLFTVYYMVYFGVLRLNKKTATKVCTVVFVLFYVIWMGSMFDVFHAVYDWEVLRMLAGVPSICVNAVLLAAVAVMQKLYAEKKQIYAAWEF